MALPISYNIRNLIERKTTTLLTALGIALPVAILLVVLALGAGLQATFQASGSPQHVLVLRKGTNAELNSSVSRQQYQDIRFKRGIAPLNNSEPAASLELVQVVNLPSVDAPDGMNVTIRGLTLAGLEIRHHVQLSAGRMFTPGQREVVVGKAIAKRYPGLRTRWKSHVCARGVGGGGSAGRRAVLPSTVRYWVTYTKSLAITTAQTC